MQSVSLHRDNVTIKSVMKEFFEVVAERERTGESVVSITKQFAAKYPSLKPESLRTALKRHRTRKDGHRQRLFSDQEERDIAGVVVRSFTCRFLCGLCLLLILSSFP